MFLFIEKQNKTLRSSNQLLQNVAAPYICLYINIHCASQIRMTNIGNKSNMKVVINISWKFVFLSVSLLKWKDIAKSLGSKDISLKNLNWTLPGPLLLLTKVLFLPRPVIFCFASIRHPACCRRWREKCFCQNQFIISQMMSLTPWAAFWVHGGRM